MTGSAAPAIPRRLGHIWIGPNAPPLGWMATWRDKHPDWTYTLYDDAFLRGRRFRNQHVIDEYMRRGQYAGVADVMRYEILHETGGFLAAADSECLHPVDELLTRPTAYTVYENEFLRGKLVCPVLACEPGNPFVGALIEGLRRVSPDQLREPWQSTGNKYVAEMIEALEPDIVVFPSHYFNPEHFEGRVYTGSDKIYARQYFGGGRNIYKPKTLLGRLTQEWRRRARKRATRALKRRDRPET